MFEGSVRRADRSIDVGCRTESHLGRLHAGGRVENRPASGRSTLDERAVYPVEDLFHGPNAISVQPWGTEPGRKMTMSLHAVVIVAGALLAWVALVHIVVGSGVRVGELVWAGRQPRLLQPSLRARSLAYAALLLLSAWVLAMAAGVVSFTPIPDRWMRSATFSVAAFLGIAFLFSVTRGSRWEQMLFAPIVLVGCLIAGWLTFA